MNMLFLYGPPATGKFTVSKELEKLTRYKLFHNHLTLDLAREILPDFDERLFELTRRLRLEAFEAAAKYNRNIIFTYVYTGDESEDDFVYATKKIIESHGGNIHFVQFTAPLGVILSRVSQESRNQFRKIMNKDELETQLTSYDRDVSVPIDDILMIDTSTLSPPESAQKISDHFKLV